MDKNLLKAFILSFVVLWLWSFFQPKDNVTGVLSNVSELIENENIESSKPLKVFDLPTIEQNSIENISIIENSKLKVQLSNLGGSLKLIEITEYNFELPLTRYLDIVGFDMFEYKLDKISEREISYLYENEEIVITKNYRLGVDDYIVQSDIKISNKNTVSEGKDISINLFTIDASILDNEGYEGRDKSLLEYVISANTDTIRKSSAFKFSEKDIKSKMENINWIGYRDRYFTAIVRPESQFDQYYTQINGKCFAVAEPADIKDVTHIYDNKSSCNAAATSNNFRWLDNLTFAISKRNVNMSVVDDFNQSFTIYFGPQRLDLLKSYDKNFEDIMKFSNWGLLDAISKGIYGVMHILYKLFPNWGICIILVSLLVYLAMYPLTISGMTSMKRMQSLQPQIRKLQDQYKSSPQKLNQEMMALYKEHKVNPLGGCLPLFLQFPVFISLYQVLWRSVSFKGANFLWIKDLSEPDRLFLFPFTLPFLGNEFNILPIVMIFVMFLQQKLSSKNMVVTDSTQAAQQRMMTTFFPIFIGFIFYKFASGLALYFTVFYLLSTLTQWKMSRMTKVV